MNDALISDITAFRLPELYAPFRTTRTTRSVITLLRTAATFTTPRATECGSHGLPSLDALRVPTVDPFHRVRAASRALDGVQYQGQPRLDAQVLYPVGIRQIGRAHV